MHLFETIVSRTESVKSTSVKRIAMNPRWFETPRIYKGDIKDKDGPAILTGLFPSDIRGEIPSRNTCLVYDLDKTDKASVLSSLGQLKSDGYEWLLHSTIQHTATTPRYRLYIPIVEPLDPERYRIVSTIVAKQYNLACDPVSHTPSICMFLPMVTPHGEDDYKYLTCEGKPIDCSQFDDEVELTVGEIYLDTGLGKLPIPDGIDEQVWIRLILNNYSPVGLDQRQWQDVLLALGHHFGGSDLGFRLFLDWQYADGLNAEYQPDDEGEIRRWRTRYDSGRPSAGTKPYTLKAVSNIKSKRGVSVLARAYRDWIRLQCDEDGIMGVLQNASSDPFCNGTMNARIITQVYKDKVKELKIDLPLKPAEVETMIQSDIPLEVEGELKDKFHSRYVFTAWSDKIYDLHTSSEISIQVFNQLYQHEMPTRPRAKGARHKPYDVVTSGMFGYKPLQTVTSQVYRVGAAPLVEENGIKLNLYQQGSWPGVPQPWDEEDKIDSEIQRTVSRHLHLMGDCDPIAAHGLLQWLAHTRQRPGARSYWGVSLLSAMGGVGKTTYRELARCILGDAQVNMIFPKDLNDQFNGFAAAPHLITFVEEPDYKADTSIHRFNVDGLKSFITDDRVSTRLHYKGSAVMDVYTQFAITGNNEHAMGPADTGRRWLTSLIEYRTSEDIDALLGCPAVRFFARYYELMTDYPDRFVAYFESINLDDYSRNKPPHTVQKRREAGLRPLNLVADLIREIVGNGAHFDMHEDAIYLPSADDIVLNYARQQDDPTLDMFIQKYSRKARYDIIKDALRSLNYVPLSDEGRTSTRLGFEKIKRPRPVMVWCRRDLFERGMTSTERNNVARDIVEKRQSRTVSLATVAL